MVCSLLIKTVWHRFFFMETVENQTSKSMKYVPVVLTEFSIIKEDRAFQIIDTTKEGVSFSGTENFRMVENVFGLAQPTLEGITNILEYYKKDIIWMNLREEPVVYINDFPYVLRDKTTPFSNIRSFVGISAHSLEEMEERLKQDVAGIARENNGFIQVHVEKQPKSLWINKVFVNKVQTVREVFESFGGRIRYHRAPVTRKLYNKENFLSILDEIFTAPQEEKEAEMLFGFNCGHGLERTSYAMTAYLVSWIVHRAGLQGKEGLTNFFAPESPSPYMQMMEQAEGDASPEASVFSRLIRVLEKVLGKEKISGWLLKVGNIMPALEKALRGEYLIVEQLGGTFNTPQARHAVNAALEKLQPFSFLELLLEHILKFQSVPEAKRSQKKAFILMERYVSLVAYSIYKIQRADMSFLEWVRSNAVIKGFVLQTVSKSSAPSSLSASVFSPADIVSLSVRPDKNMRNWMTVIGARTVLKVDRPEVPGSLEPIKGFYAVPQPTDESALPALPPSTIWVNLRAEPVVYIGAVAHSEKERNSLYGNIKTVSGITKELIKNQESLLCQRIRNEGTKMKGQIVLFDTTPKGELVSKRVTVNGQKVLTCDVFLQHTLKGVRYERVPLISKSPLNPYTIDELLSVVLARGSARVVFQASGCEGRAQSARLLGVVVDLAQSLKHTEEFLSQKQPMRRPVPIRGIETLLRVLPNGQAAEYLVQTAYTQTGKRSIYTQLKEMKEEYKGTAITNHFLMITLASFVLAMPDGKPASFRQWINKRQDIVHIYNEIKEMPVCSTNSLPLITREWGSVLTPHTILKNDFFPSLRVLREGFVDIKGCSNFRSVVMEKTEIVGLAQPTQWGVRGLLERFVAGPAPVHWFCLREEPVVYIKGFPYVLRTTDMVYENVITTGITREWVEDIEERMKTDCLEENRKNGITIHNEKALADGEVKLVEEVIRATSCEVCTPKEAFYHKSLSYYRMPISDEQTPLPEMFDELYQSFMAIPVPRTLVFSCQMGRGRTTTGMIVAGLVSLVEKIKSLSPEEQANHHAALRQNVVYPDRYLTISKLLQVLPKGRESKNLVDKLICEFEHIQNIYHAIATARTTGYLIRYFYLICFGSFLLETVESSLTFKEYLLERMEITAIVNEKEYYPATSKSV
ncbi:hypothetical protein NECID01_1854 [Nematocida sp. AWRm77]|nr:hypothetical protein NECID01_1854 [Nematocida sp. AWRm77]